jgi:RNA polymerase sigma-70 factor (ECF subfamily)
MPPRHAPTGELDIHLLRTEFQERDLELVRRVLLDDEGAKEEIYKFYAPYVASFLRKEFQSQFWPLSAGTLPGGEHFDDVGIRNYDLPTELDDAVNDVVADTFLRAFERLESYKPEKSAFVTWLFTIAKRLMLNKLRDEVWLPEGIILLGLESEHLLHRPSNTGDPERILLSREERQAARTRAQEILGSLNRRWGEALWLRYGLGLKVREVAQAMGLSEDATESLIRRARQGVIKKWGDESGLDT